MYCGTPGCPSCDIVQAILLVQRGTEGAVRVPTWRRSRPHACGLLVGARPSAIVLVSAHYASPTVFNFGGPPCTRIRKLFSFLTCSWPQHRAVRATSVLYRITRAKGR